MIGRLKKIFLLPLCWLLLAGVARGALAVRVQVVKGQVTAQTGDRFLRVSRGTALTQGAIVRTGAGGEAVLAWPTGHVVKLGPLSVFTLNNPGPGPVRLHLKEGNLSVAAEKLKDSQFVVETPELVAGVRGTFFAVDRAPAASAVKVLQGQVWVKVGGVERVLGPGLKLAARLGMPLPMPQAIPKAEFFDLQADHAETLRLQQEGLLEWDGRWEDGGLDRFDGERLQDGEGLDWEELSPEEREAIKRELNEQGITPDDLRGEAMEETGGLDEKPPLDMADWDALSPEEQKHLLEAALSPEDLGALGQLPPHLLEQLGGDLLMEQIKNELLDQVEKGPAGVRLLID